MSHRKDYEEKLKSKLEQLEKDIDALKAKVQEVERKVRAGLRPGEARAVVTYAGTMVTETSPRLGDHRGQVLVGLHPRQPGMRDVEEITAALARNRARCTRRRVVSGSTIAATIPGCAILRGPGIGPGCGGGRGRDQRARIAQLFGRVAAQYAQEIQTLIIGGKAYP